MPNWCYTDISISRPAKDGGVKELYDKLLEATARDSSVENDFGKMWLGNIVEKLLKEDPVSGGYECRGTLCQFDMTEAEDEINLGTETAWGPMLKMWLDIIDKYCPGAEFVYTAEESGNGLYQTNDPDYIGKYYVDSWENEVEAEWVASEDYVRSTARKLTGKKCDRRTKIENVVEMVNDLEKEIYINKWDYNPDLSEAV